MLRINVFLAAFAAAAVITAQAHAGPRQTTDSQAPGTHCGAQPCSQLPNDHLTLNGRLFALGQVLVGSSRLHATRFN